MTFLSHQTTLKLTPFNQAPRSCDQCYRRHIRCDKRKPICNQCEYFKESCTHKLKIQFENSKNLKQKTNNTKKIKTGQLQLGRFNTKNDINTILVQLNLKKWMQNSRIRFDLYSFLNILGIPMFSSTPSQHKVLMKFLISVYPPSLNSRKVLFMDFNVHFLFKELLLGIKAYFHYVNPFFPIFEEKDFFLKPRSNFLKATMARIGLQFLDNTLLRTDLMNEIDKILLCYTKPSMLTPCLDTIQAILVLSYALDLSPLDAVRRSCFYAALSWLHVLGFNNKSKLSKEAQMVTHICHFQDFIYSSVFNSLFLTPLSLKLPKPNFDPVNYYFRVTSSCLKRAYLYAPHVSATQRILGQLNKYTYYLITQLKSPSIARTYVILQYHFHYLFILDQLFKTSKVAIPKLFRQTGTVHANLIIYHLVPISLAPFAFCRQFMIITAIRVLNTWALPSNSLKRLTGGNLPTSQSKTMFYSLKSSEAFLSQHFYE